jgi:type II secretion system protein G
MASALSMKGVLMVNRDSGFTLIELLIVVAIIAILAAIAVPNFLEAQVRAKVSRAKADVRTITTALEAYNVSYNHYPPNPDTGVSFNITPYQLTTPVSFLSSRPMDPFKLGKDVTQNTNPDLRDERFYYDYFSIISFEEYTQLSNPNIFLLSVDKGSGGFPVNEGAFQKYGKWLQWSVGPDALLWIEEDDFFPGSGLLKDPVHEWGYSFDTPYDPTNGTVSFGNIIRSQMRSDGLVPYIP